MVHFIRSIHEIRDLKKIREPATLRSLLSLGMLARVYSLLFLESENLNVEVTVVIAWSDYPHIAHATSEGFKYLAHLLLLPYGITHAPSIAGA